MVLMFGILYLMFFITILMPLWFINYLPLSGVGHFFANNSVYGIFFVIFLIYFIIVGGYYFSIELDPYMIKITSYRPFFELLRKKDYVDIAHSMLIDFRFFNRPFTFNKTLMLKINTNSNKNIIKRFNLSFLTYKEQQNISNFLQNIIAKNNINGK